MWGIPQDRTAGRQELAGLMEARWRGEGGGAYEPGRWCPESEEFRQELLPQVNDQGGSRHTGKEVRQPAQGKAERIVQEGLTS